ncbi:hypothetical protein MRB53_041140 [Persea americana]|nr:hypothetical protein MRB53_041140 [Persea americana]
MLQMQLLWPSPVRGSAEGSDTRRSIVGSDRDRAEVLAAVKKGILKRSGTSSPSGSPVIRPSDGTSPAVQLTESPASSRPGTPNHGVRAGSLNGDYFNQRMVSMTKSMPNTPHGSLRSISFSPRIQFHEAWAATEYDRRGEIATCNRLTPMLAQQIKEELNTFKMIVGGDEDSVIVANEGLGLRTVWRPSWRCFGENAAEGWPAASALWDFVALIDHRWLYYRRKEQTKRAQRTCLIRDALIPVGVKRLATPYLGAEEQSSSLEQTSKIHIRLNQPIAKAADV